MTGRDTRYLNVIGGNYHGVDVSPEPIGNMLREILYDPIIRYGTSHSIFSNLNINRFGIRLVNGSNNMISHCIISNTNYNGIQIYGPSNNMIHGNKISNVGLANNSDYRYGICVVADNEFQMPMIISLNQI